MKKAFAVVLCLIALVMLTGYSSAGKQVPEKTLEWAVEDYLESLGLGEPNSRNAEIDHDTDAATHTDTVTIQLSADYTYYSIGSTCVTTYEYNKASDLWTVIRDGKWEPVHITQYHLPITAEEIIQVLELSGEDYEYKEYSSEEYFGNSEWWFAKLFLDSGATPDATGWIIRSSSFVLEKIQFNEPKSILPYFDGIVEGRLSRELEIYPTNTITETVNSAGENYHLRLFLEDHKYFECINEHYFLGIEQTYYSMYSNNWEQVEIEPINAIIESCRLLSEAQ